MEDKVKIRGARQHNLKNIDVDIPKNRLVVISGLSGSGKSTLAFDTLYAEGQRRYVESLSAYARQFLEMMDKPDVDSIDGLSPAISIQQKTTSKNPRSTVGTVTEIYDYMRLLYARVGIPHCIRCGGVISSQSVEAICDTVLKEFQGRQVLVLAPVVQHKKGTYDWLFESIKKDGYSRIRVDGSIVPLDGEMPPLDKQKWHNVEIVVDRLTAEKSERSRLFESVGTALRAAKGYVMISAEADDRIFSQNNACPKCKISIGTLEPRSFSFNSPFGMCKGCNGLGHSRVFHRDLIIPDDSRSILEGAIVPWDYLVDSFGSALRRTLKAAGIKMNMPIRKMAAKQLDLLLHGSDARRGLPGTYMGIFDCLYRLHASSYYGMGRDRLDRLMMDIPCDTCNGKKLNAEARAVTVGGMGIMDVCDLPVDQCYDFFATINLSDTEQYIARDVLKEIRGRLEFLRNVGLDYLTLGRSSSSLSGGESQRIRLATQIGSNLTGVLYVLDEPTVGLHQRDNARLIRTLAKLRDLGNTIIVVEHDEEVIRSSDWIIDLGPRAGVNGGRIVFEGTVQKMLGSDGSITGRYLNGKEVITLKERTRRQNGSILVEGAAVNNLKSIDVEFPLGLFIVVTGVSGSGKSSLVNEILLKSLEYKLHDKRRIPGRHDRILGIGNIDRIIAIDQSPIGRTPRSNPATYIGAFTPIRQIFAKTGRAKEMGYAIGQFSFNVDAGRCFECEGNGLKRIEMQFLSDVYVQCDRCHGKRYNSETLAVRYKGKNVSDVLDMTVDEAIKFFENVPSIRKKMQTIYDVGLGYIKLGQSSTTLSGGEAQRVKLAAELSKTDTGRTMYILDEPTTGLHFADVQKLLEVINRLVNLGNTAVVIEHNMDVIGNSDWVIDLGPEGGLEGGRVVATGTPEQISASPGSYTGKYLKKFMSR